MKRNPMKIDHISGIPSLFAKTNQHYNHREQEHENGYFVNSMHHSEIEARFIAR
jgi:hypothetical protein